QHQQRGRVDGGLALLVGQRRDDQLLADVVVTQDSPAGALQTQCCGGELVLELLEGAEVAVDGLSQLAGRLAATVRGEVLPEDGVVGVATKVERKVLGQRADLIREIGRASCRERAERGEGGEEREARSAVIEG